MYVTDPSILWNHPTRVSVWPHSCKKSMPISMEAPWWYIDMIIYFIPTNIRPVIIIPPHDEVVGGVIGFTLSVRPSRVRPASHVRSVAPTVLVGSISYLCILPSNFRRCVACKVSCEISKFRWGYLRTQAFYLKSWFDGQVVASLQERYRDLLGCLQMPSQRSYIMFVKPAVLTSYQLVTLICA